MPLKKLDFLRFFWTLDDLERSGRPVGIISTYFRQNSSRGFRAMTKNPPKLTTKKQLIFSRKEYAYIKVVVDFLVVKFWGFLVIALNPRNEF